MGGQKSRRVAPRRSADSAVAGASTARWAELPREIVAMIASYTCAPVQPLPLTCLLHSADPDSTAYHRHDDRSFIGPGAPFATGQGQDPPGPGSGRGPMGQPGGGSGGGSSAGPSTSRAPPGAADVGDGGAAELVASIGGYVPGTFRPSRMSDTALAMRCVCRLWSEVLSEGVRMVALPQGMGAFTLWASHFPCISHLGLGSCTDLLVRNHQHPQPPPAAVAAAAEHPPRRRGRSGGGAAAGSGDQAGPGPSNAAAAATAGGGSGRRRGAALGSSDDGDAPAAPPRKVRSLAALTSLRHLQVFDSAVHLDLAANCPRLEELVVWAQRGRQYGPHPDRNSSHHPPAYPLAFAPPGAGLVGRSRGGAAPSSPHSLRALPATRRSALDCALSRLPALRRLRFSGVDASAARLGSALMALSGLTSLRLQQCLLPTFIGGPGRARPGLNNFGRELVLNLGAKLQDLSLQGCCLRLLPDEVLAALTGLRLLDLSCNWLEALPASVTMLSRLEYLDLQRNLLRSLPEGLPALTQLADLDLAGSRLHRLPADFGGLTALTHLNLGDIHSLDMGLCWQLLTALTNLHSLGLCDVDLSVEVGAPIPAGGGEGGGWRGPLHALISALAPSGRLRELMLDGCGLDTLPTNFTDLTALTTLSLMENFDASVVPDAITSLRCLAVLRLGYLDLSAPLPPGLFELTGLRELDLEQNFLPGLPAGISKLTNLQILNLMDAFDPEPDPEPAGGVIPWTAIYKLTRLRRLSASGPEAAPPVGRGIGALAGLESLALHCVTVSGPLLEELCTGLRALTSLDLFACRISALPAAVTRLQRLTELQLRQNRLMRLPAGLGTLTRLVELGLSGNLQLRSLPADMTRLSRLRALSWSVFRGSTAPPSPEQLAWLAGLPELSLQGTADFAELAKSHNIPWPHLAEHSW